jgi:hypothetical protein
MACAQAYVYPQGIDDLRDVIRQTDVSSESALLSRFGSEDAELTEAVFVIGPATVGRTTMSIVAVAPLDIVPSVHVTVPSESPHTPVLEIAETNTTLDGSLSVTVTSDAGSGPSLVTVSV